MVRTERESDRKRQEKWQTCWCCQDQQRACRMAQASAEKLEHTGPAEKERVASVPQREQLASTPEPLLPKGKEPSVQSTRLWGGGEGGEGQGEREHGVKRVNSTVKEGKFQRGEGGKVRKASLGEVEGNMSRCVNTKAPQDDLQSFGFTPSQPEPEMEKEVGRRRARS